MNRTIPVIALAAALGAGGCFVQSERPDTVPLSVSLSAPGPSTYQSGGPELWDSTGLFQLTRFPKLVRVAVTINDYEAVSGTWPDPNTGLGLGEGQSGQVAVSLDAPVGNARRLRLVAFYRDLQGSVTVYHEDQPTVIDVISGKTQQVTLNAARHEVGTLDLTVRCQRGNTGPWLPFSVALVDGRALALHPPRALTNVAGALKLTVKGVPVGRPHWARIWLQDGTSRQKTLDLRHPTFQVTTANATRSANLVIPCNPTPVTDGGTGD